MADRETMRVIAADAACQAQDLEITHVPIPQVQAGQYLVKVHAAGINRPDVLQRQGLYPPPSGASNILGLEIAGEVVAAGAGADRFAPGETLCALVTSGGYGEYCLVNAATALPIPQGLSLVQAAALPETFFTVWHNVFERGQLQRGENFLVHGGTSGIGTTAIQMANAFGAKVFATAGSAEKCATCKDLGANRSIDYTTEDFVDVLKTETQGHGADVILDMVGGDYIQRNIKAAALDGRIVQIAFLKGAKVELNMMPVMLKRLTLTGSTLRARSNTFKGKIAQALETNVWPLLENGSIQPVIDSTYPLEDAGKAHDHMETSTHIGKIVLTTT